MSYTAGILSTGCNLGPPGLLVNAVGDIPFFSQMVAFNLIYLENGYILLFYTMLFYILYNTNG